MNRRFVAIASFLVIFAIAALHQQVVYGQITSPATNSFQVAGADQQISWKVKNDSTSIVLLQYSTDGGQSWNYIASSGIAAGSYDWIIPVTINSFLCKVRIVKYTGRGFTTVATTGNFSIARMSPLSTINHVFSHRVMALTDTGTRHFNRLRFFK